MFFAAARGPAFRDPLRDASIQYCDGVVPEPAQQPSQAAGVHAVVLIVGDHLYAALDAKPAEGVCKCLRIG